MTVDLTQPATPAEFIAAGATPEQAASLATQANIMAGRHGPDARAGMAFELRNVPPPPKAGPAPSSVAPAEATAALQAHTDAQLSAQLARDFAPPSSPMHYSFPTSLDPETPEAQAADMELRTALHAEGFPRFVVESIGRELATAATTRANETEAQAQTRIAATRATLERWYGKDTDANLRLVDGVLDRLLAKGGGVADFVDNALPHLDALSIDALVQFAKHRPVR